jgi:seryl-tRNA synthetase
MFPRGSIPTIKIELSNGVESSQPVWDGHGSDEDFLCHMLGMREALVDMGLFEKYEEARQKVSKAKEQMQDEKNLRDVVLGQIENSDLESDKVPLREEVAKHNENIKGCRAAVAVAKEEVTAAMATIFSTTANFFRGDGKTPWDNIVHEQTEKEISMGRSSPGSAAR